MNTRRMKRYVLPKLFRSCYIVVIAGLWTVIPASSQDSMQKSLYERLGGVYNIATVVDDFIERLLVDEVLNANPAIKAARDRVPKAGLKFQVTALVCQATGGPQAYAGRSMKEAHRHLNITEAEWQALAKDFKISLDKFKVPEREQKELFAIVATTKKDIVVSGETVRSQH